MNAFPHSLATHCFQSINQSIALFAYNCQRMTKQDNTDGILMIQSVLAYINRIRDAREKRRVNCNTRTSVLGVFCSYSDCRVIDEQTKTCCTTILTICE